jgi:integrase
VANRPKASDGSGTLQWKDFGRRWELRFQVNGIRQSEYFSVNQFGSKERAKREAERRRRSLSGKTAEGLLVLTRDMSLHDFARQWVDRQTHLEDATQQEYWARLQYLLCTYPSASVRVLGSGEALSTLFGKLREDGYAAKTIGHVHHVVGQVVEAAVAKGYIKFNPLKVERIRRPKIDPREYRLFTASELYAMLNDPKTQDGPLECVIALIGLCGLRPGEAIALRWSDIEDDWVHIRSSGRRETTKTKSGRRTIQMPERAVEAVNRLRRLGLDSERLFPSLTVNVFGMRFNALQKRLNMEPTGRPYDLRHTAITHAIAYADNTSGVSIADVAQWAGHSRNSTTLDTYCHVLRSSPGLSDIMNHAYQQELDQVRASDVPNPSSTSQTG